MSNLLNGIAAALTSAVSRNRVQGSGSAQDENNYTFPERFMRLCCYYGMSIQRTINTAVRKTKRVVRPVRRRAVRGIKNAVVLPMKETAAELSEISADLRKTKTRIEVARRIGVMAAARERIVVTAATAAKHKTFLGNIVNIALPILSLAVLAVVVLSLVNTNYALAVECDGVVVGYIGEESAYTGAAQMVEERVLSTSPEFKSTLTPTYKLAAVNKNEPLSNSQEICENILFNSDNVSEAYGFFINGKLLAAIESEGDMNFILDEFLNKYKSGNATNATTTFVQSTEVVKGLYSSDIIMDSAAFKNEISTEKLQSQLYTVKSGDTISKLTKRYSMTEERLYEMNEGLMEDGLKKGQSILIEKEMPVLEVKSVSTRYFNQSIAYGSTNIVDKTKYKDYKKLKTAGVKGTKKITQEITYVDGVEVSRKNVKSEVVKEAVDEVWIVGSKARPTTTKKKTNYGSSSKIGNQGSKTPIKGSGTFTWPVPGVRGISSYYGQRWGKMHKGIDISGGGVSGRTIVAADAGKVVTSKYHSSYGYYIVIKHNNTYSTLYAHCSKLLVKAGTYVSKGQAIGKVGSTGNSTGPHLHFEVHVNGSHRNPLNYL
jgi:murein DD-endopeptidase MepM/ murein hydrolase activator NlpD